MWSRIGDFHGLHNWHPAIVASAPLADGAGRELTLGDGAKLYETRLEEGPRSYTYRIDRGPLPVSGYRSTVSVREQAGGGCEVGWEAEFEAEGVSEAEAAALLGGIFDAGLEAI